MYLSDKFITRTESYTTQKNNVNAPYLRREFVLDEVIGTELTICALGLYELYVNGERITKGLLAPYMYNPTHFSYYDVYDISSFVKKGNNAIGVVLGNGFVNSVVQTWDFDKFSWRSSPRMAIAVEVGGRLLFEADESFKTAPSPILFDNMHYGCHYDARLEQDGWNKVGFDDKDWQPAIKVKSFGGEKRLVEAPPIIIEREVKPIKITKLKNGYLYDFGINSAGLSKLTLKNAQKGQKLSITHGEWLVKGKLTTSNIRCGGMSLSMGYSPQADKYIAKGDKVEEFIPYFTYHGFQYIFVKGITDEQATEELFTFLIAHSDLKETGSFVCSDEIANKLQKCARNSDFSNFYYYPTDCPHREKNGWTGDAAVSAEHMLLNFDCVSSLKEWLRSIRSSQNKEGALPGIVPTDTWGFKWGNGPCWDAVLTYLPYYVYRYTGDMEIVRDNVGAIDVYLHYLERVASGHRLGLIEIGLGDWLQPLRGAGAPDAPILVTNSIMTYNLTQKAKVLFKAAGEDEKYDFADNFGKTIKERIRNNLIDFSTFTVNGDCQTSQLAAIFYEIFEDNEMENAVKKLIELIKKEDDHFAVGMVGNRIIFHTLTKYGYSDLAYKMITQDSFPSYGYWLKYGASSLWECFYLLEEDTSIIKRKSLESEYVFKNDGPFAWFFKFAGKIIKKAATFFKVRWDGVSSLNHHFFGDISGWFIKAIAGININPTVENIYNVDICPNFIEKLTFAEAYHDMPYGRITSRWDRKGDTVTLNLVLPEKTFGTIKCPIGYTFDDNMLEKPLASGKYTFKRTK